MFDSIKERLSGDQRERNYNRVFRNEAFPPILNINEQRQHNESTPTKMSDGEDDDGWRTEGFRRNEIQAAGVRFFSHVNRLKKFFVKAEHSVYWGGALTIGLTALYGGFFIETFGLLGIAVTALPLLIGFYKFHVIYKRSEGVMDRVMERGKRARDRRIKEHEDSLK